MTAEEFQWLREAIGDEEFHARIRAQEALYNEYGFVPDLTRIRIHDTDGGICFSVGRHDYQLYGNDLTKTK